MAIEDAMQKQNIDILPDLYSDFAQFIYVVRTQYFDASIKYAMLCQCSKTFWSETVGLKCADYRVHAL
jgi:hypothetical protein